MVLFCSAKTFVFHFRWNFKGRKLDARVIYPLQQRYVSSSYLVRRIPWLWIHWNINWRCLNRMLIIYLYRFLRWPLRYTWLSFENLGEILWNFTRYGALSQCNCHIKLEWILNFYPGHIGVQYLVWYYTQALPSYM